ncbi:MAG: S-adenosyl methyltransferase, partial [Trebonia sp.]|nr:S-adenosyl methyltransferase [Trebonia sp.]
MITGSPGGTLRFGTVADFDPTIPSIARVYDYLLDGKDNF